MRKIVLISCASKKGPAKARARDLYTSALFRLNLQYAHKLKPDAVFILSAKYGLLALDDEIEPYNVTLNTMNVTERRAWASNVLDHLNKYSDLARDHFIFLAGKRYYEFLIPSISSYEIPTQGLSIGKQLQYLSRQMLVR